MLKIEKSNSTPEILVDENSFRMLGICTPENPPRFFDTFKTEFDTVLERKTSIEMSFHLDYFNTGSSKCLLNLFKAVSQSRNKENVKIKWMYEKGDEEMRESGELYAEIAEIEFEFVEV